jgi:hypothetical protein
LNAAELQAEGVGDGADHEGLGGSGEAGEQAMAADEEGDEDLVEDFVLADDDLSYLADNASTDGVEAFDVLLKLGCVLVEIG